MRQTSLEAFQQPRTQTKIETETERIYEVFKKYPNSELTAHDIADLSGLNYFVVQKRKSILERRKLIKSCGVHIVNGYQRTKYKKA